MEAIDAIKKIIEIAGKISEGGETGSTAYDLAYVFVGPWVSIADGASQLLGMFA
ncbi:hypothetical protein Q0N48_05010 [Corynebacterium ureicelerivorans]|uniref:hypothetical protein n=1 Tax=Corynebacterium ureicelerivorans TaxID=401472 RepID=UPI0026570E4F|nr:hypothetical protein [Corynebacterium ureicelerivorans]MDN8605361.1 hypothetical protein [Corynebacterium ureicelerivorans]